MKDLLVLLLEQIPQTSCTYTKLFSEFLCKLSESGLNELDRLLTDHFVASSKSISDLNSIQSFRVLEILIQVSCTRPENLTHLIEPRFGLSNRLGSYLSTDNPDILSRMNCIELVTCLVDTDHGIEYFEASGYLKVLFDALVEPNADPFATLLVPSLVKLFATITKKSMLYLSLLSYFRIYFYIFILRG